MNTNGTMFTEVLDGFSINAKCVSYESREHYDIFNIQLLKGCKISNIESVSREIQLALRLDSSPVFIPDMKTGFLQMISAKRTDAKLSLRSIFKSKHNNMCCQIGVDSRGDVINLDITEAPHVLVAGTTGSGKSVCLHVLVANILAMRGDATQILIDPKRVEFEIYKSQMNSNIWDVYNTYDDAMMALKFAEKIMEDRYKWLATHGYKNVKDAGDDGFPALFIIIDEIGELIAQDKNEIFTKLLCKLAAKSRAAGIHFVIATQRASATVINGLIKANFPTRIVFKVASAIESRIVIDENGAENLTSRGDGILFGYNGVVMRRFKAAFVDQHEAVTYSRALSIVA
jgi:DNA segregation ATPase FtsK/SpoIIIE, S-DNA-T family